MNLYKRKATFRRKNEKSIRNILSSKLYFTVSQFKVSQTRSEITINLHAMKNKIIVTV